MNNKIGYTKPDGGYSLTGYIEPLENFMDISELLTSYLDTDEPQYKIADDINDAMGWQYITPMAISYWINGIHPPTIKTARTIQAAATGELRELFDAIIGLLEPVQG
jgi:hypothetical protein